MGPIRSAALGGVAFGVAVLVVGILIFLADQRIISISLSFWTFCSVLLIGLGIVAIVGTLWARRMVRGGWRKWVPGWDRDDWDRQM